MFGIGKKKKQTGQEVVVNAVEGITTLVGDLEAGLTQLDEEIKATQTSREDAKKAWEAKDAEHDSKITELAEAAANGFKLKTNIANLLK